MLFLHTTMAKIKMRLRMIVGSSIQQQDHMSENFLTSVHFLYISYDLVITVDSL